MNIKKLIVVVSLVVVSNVCAHQAQKQKKQMSPGVETFWSSFGAGLTGLGAKLAWDASNKYNQAYDNNMNISRSLPGIQRTTTNYGGWGPSSSYTTSESVDLSNDDKLLHANMYQRTALVCGAVSALFLYRVYTLLANKKKPRNAFLKKYIPDGLRPKMAGFFSMITLMWGAIALEQGLNFRGEAQFLRDHAKTGDSMDLIESHERNGIETSRNTSTMNSQLQESFAKSREKSAKFYFGVGALLHLGSLVSGMCYAVDPPERPELI